MTDPTRQAFEHYNAGRMDEAAKLCRAVLAAKPDQPEVSHLLGVIFFRQGDTAAARDFLKRAADSPRATAEMHNNFGAVLNARGEFDLAADAFRHAIALKPDYPWAFNNLGVLYRDRKLPGAAIDAFKRAVALKPDFAEAKANLKAAYRDLIPAWHFTMLHDKHRNEVYEAAIRRAVKGKRVLEIGTGTGLLSMLAARAGAKSVVTCEAVDVIAERAREIVAQNGLKDRVKVVGKRSTDLVGGDDLPERAEVLITETFSSNLLDEGIIPTIEHAHEHLLAENALVIPAAASAFGFLVGGELLHDMLFVGRIKDLDLSAFNDFAPPNLAVSLGSMPHEVLSDDAALLRFDLNQRRFPPESRNVTLTATRAGTCVGVAQWIRIELDQEIAYDNRPSPDAANAHWSQLIYRFPRPVPVAPGDIVQIVASHDRTQIAVELAQQV
jgi:type II protein arginine methyltransferase